MFLLVIAILWVWQPLSGGISSKKNELSKEEEFFFESLIQKLKLDAIKVNKYAKYSNRFTFKNYSYNISLSGMYELQYLQSLSRHIISELCDSKLITTNDKYEISFYATMRYPNHSVEQTSLSYNGYFTDCKFDRGYLQ